VSDFFDEEEEYERIVLDKSKKVDSAAAQLAAKEHIEAARVEREQKIENTQERAEPLLDVESISVAELADMIVEMIGSRSKIIRRPLPIDDPVQRCPDIAEAERILGWHPKTALKDGLARTIDYFDKLLGSDPGRGH